MPWPVSIVAAVGVALFGSPVVEPGALARAEIQAGSAPVEPGKGAEGAVLLQGVPTVALRLRWPRATVTSRYGPRFFFRIPDTLGRPLVLHQGAVTYESRIARDVDERASVDARIGDVDYTSVAAGEVPLLPRGQSRIPKVSVLELFEVRGTSELGFALSRTASLAWLLGASHIESLGSKDAFAPLTTLGTGATYTERIDRRDQLKVPVFVQHHAFGSGGPVPERHAAKRLLASEAGVSLLRRLDRRSDVEVGGGLVEVEDLDGTDDSKVLPTTSVTATHGFVHQRRERLQGTLHLGLLAVLDTINKQYDWVAGGGGGLELQLRPKWSIGARVSLYTTLNEDPNTSTGPQSYRVRVAAELPVVYHFSPTAVLEFGARTEARAPGLGPNDWDRSERQVWGYAAVTVAFGADRTAGRWLL